MVLPRFRHNFRIEFGSFAKRLIDLDKKSLRLCLFALPDLRIKWLRTLGAMVSTRNTGSTDRGCYSESATLFPWFVCSCQVWRVCELRVLAARPGFGCITFLVLENMSCEDHYKASQGNSGDFCRDWNLLSRESLCALCRGKVCKNFERTSGAPTLTKMFVATCQFSRVVIRGLGCRRMDNPVFWIVLGHACR